MNENSLRGALAAIVGDRHVLAAASDTAPYLTDWRRQYRGSALCVVRPASTAEVSAVVRLCAETGVPIVPPGGNTGLSGGSVPAGTPSQIVLLLSRPNRNPELDALNDTISVEAGRGPPRLPCPP